jgi:hypothetical protein
MKPTMQSLNRHGIRGLLGLALVAAACGGPAEQAPPAQTTEPGAAAGSEDPKPPAGTTAERSAQAQAVQDLSLARRLAEYGNRNQSAIALALSAQILMNTPTQPVQGQPEAEAAQPPQGAAAGQKEDRPAEQLEAANLLAQAEGMAGDNAQVRALIEQLKSRAEGAPRGAAALADAGYYRVPAYTTNIHRLNWETGEVGQVCIDGDNDTDLDLYVFGAAGLIISSRGPWDDECVEWYVRGGGQFRIEVRNLGDVYNDYYFVTN